MYTAGSLRLFQSIGIESAVEFVCVVTEDTEIYIWAAIDVETFEVVHIEASPGRSDLDVLLFVKQVLNGIEAKLWTALLVSISPSLG